MEASRRTVVHQRATVNLVIENQELREKFARVNSKMKTDSFCFRNVKGHNNYLRKTMKKMEQAIENEIAEKVVAQGKLLKEELKVKMLTRALELRGKVPGEGESASKKLCLENTIVLDK